MTKISGIQPHVDKAAHRASASASSGDVSPKDPVRAATTSSSSSPHSDAATGTDISEHLASWRDRDIHDGARLVEAASGHFGDDWLGPAASDAFASTRTTQAASSILATAGDHFGHGGVAVHILPVMLESPFRADELAEMADVVDERFEDDLDGAQAMFLAAASGLNAEQTMGLVDLAEDQFGNGGSGVAMLESMVYSERPLADVRAITTAAIDRFGDDDEFEAASLALGSGVDAATAVSLLRDVDSVDELAATLYQSTD